MKNKNLFNMLFASLLTIAIICINSCYMLVGYLFFFWSSFAFIMICFWSEVNIYLKWPKTAKAKEKQILPNKTISMKEYLHKFRIKNYTYFHMFLIFSIDFYIFNLWISFGLCILSGKSKIIKINTDNRSQFYFLYFFFAFKWKYIYVTLFHFSVGLLIIWKNRKGKKINDIFDI